MFKSPRCVAIGECIYTLHLEFKPQILKQICHMSPYKMYSIQLAMNIHELTLCLEHG